jgi:tRNA 2-selenouridine synthase
MADELPQTDDYLELFLRDTPLLDVRAPVEFAEGAFPTAENLPLVDDDERHVIGIRYKEAGQDAAVELGETLVSGDHRAQRVAAWRAFVERHPGAVLYCFRGGMRSKISQAWLHEHTGLLVPRVKGGYKALRRFLIDRLAESVEAIEPVVLGGRTGVGKTLLLRRLDNAVDLEALAWHRGSAFGRHAQPQPTQIDFENRLSIALLKHRERGISPLVFEDESKNIGSRHLPQRLYERLKAAPLAVLEASVEERVENTLQEYVVESLAEYQALHGRQAGFDAWAEALLGSLDRIRKRLGGARHQALRAIMTEAVEQQRQTGRLEGHRDWIATLLVEYYDPMYDYQIDGNAGRVRLSGRPREVLEWLRSTAPQAQPAGSSPT